MSWSSPFFQGSSRNSLREHLICVAYLTYESIFMNINVNCLSLRHSTEMAFKDLSSRSDPIILECETLSKGIFLLSQWCGEIRAVIVPLFYGFTRIFHVPDTAQSIRDMKRDVIGSLHHKTLQEWVSRTCLKSWSFPERKPVLLLKFPSCILCPLVLVGPFSRSDVYFWFSLTNF